MKPRELILPIEMRRKRFRVRSLWIALLLMVVAAGIRYWPRESLEQRIPSSVAVFGSRGELLRLTLASDQQYRIWTPLEKVSPELIEALLMHEDRHFYTHLGVNPIALARAANATYAGGTRQGGSTLTMQLARLLYRLNTRTVGGKLQQIVLATGLELRYSKHDLLEAHLNLMPYGGNVQGVGAASLIYFCKRADQLVLSEALSLVVIPQSPVRRDPNGAEPETLRAARERLFARWVDAHPPALEYAHFVSMPVRFAPAEQLPFIAPHFTSMLLGKNHGQSEIRTTLDVPVQQLAEDIVGTYIREETRIGIRNAAVLLADVRDMSVRAMVGSADFFSAEIQGQVNGTLAKRSPGSALKPFIYALAMDHGIIHPLTVLKDAPTNFGGFSPENFDGRFAGPISATEALTRSRNIPAVDLSAHLDQPSLYQFLKTAGIGKLAPENHYGLSLALGGGEVTMEEAVTLYAVLARRGSLAPLRYRSDEPQQEGTRLLSEEASFMTLDMLASAARPDGNQWSRNSPVRVAWKTGTSWGFRDAWTVGAFGPYVLAVWVGNFDGSSNPAFVGVQAAAPLFFRLVDGMEARERTMRELFSSPPRHLIHVEVCAASGDLPNADCPQTASTWYIPGVSPIKVSQVHRRVWIDTRTGLQACAPMNPEFTRSEVYEFWPSDLQQLFVQAGMPRRRPPSAGVCGGDASRGVAPRISSPVANVAYSIRATADENNAIPLAVSVDGDVRRVHWFVDDSYIGTVAANASLAWNTTASGRHLIRAIDDHGRTDTREINVMLRQ